MQEPKPIEWTEKTIAENYEFARPLDEAVLSGLFKKITQLTNSSFDGKVLLDAGCGTGRLTFPLAENQPKIRIVGIDRSQEMLGVLKRKIDDSGIKNYEVVEMDLLKTGFQDNYFDYSLVSSVLHSTREWGQIMLEIVRATKNGGFLMLFSEESDMYNLVLNRAKNDNKTLLERFWGHYQELRKEKGLPSPERSQVGIKWQLGHPELIDFLKEQGNMASFKEFDTEWQKAFTIADMLKIVENRSYSSMFTVDGEKYALVVNGLKDWVEKEKISLSEQCASNITIKCEIVEIKKP